MLQEKCVQKLHDSMFYDGRQINFSCIFFICNFLLFAQRTQGVRLHCLAHLSINHDEPILNKVMCWMPLNFKCGYILLHLRGQGRTIS